MTNMEEWMAVGTIFAVVFVFALVAKWLISMAPLVATEPVFETRSNANMLRSKRLIHRLSRKTKPGD